MQTISSIEAYYPSFVIGGEPTAIRCEIRIVESNGRRFLKTPFAMLDAHGDDDHERQIGRGFYATAAECESYLAGQYPHWRTAAPIADELNRATASRGKMMGEAHIESITGLNSLTGELYRAARGDRAVTLKTIKQAVKAIAKAKGGAK